MIAQDKSCPCMDCKQRRVACHDHCEKYKAWHSEQAKKKAEYSRKRQADATIAEYIKNRRPVR